MLPAIPVTDEQAKAVAATAKLGQTIVDEGGQLARYIGRVLGTIPEDTVGLVLGDPLHAVRTVIAAKLDDMVTTVLARRGVKQVEAVSPSIAIPLLRAAYDENRPELQKLWADLIAAAMDPARSNRVRLSFIDAVKQFDPLDALLLQERFKSDGNLSPSVAEYMASVLQRRRPEIDVSSMNLERLGCFSYPTIPDISNFNINTYGRELMRACLE